MTFLSNYQAFPDFSSLSPILHAPADKKSKPCPGLPKRKKTVGFCGFLCCILPLWGGLGGENVSFRSFFCARVKNILAQLNLARCAYFIILIQSHHSSIPAISPDSRTSRCDPLSLSVPVRHTASPHSLPAFSFLPASSVSMSFGHSLLYNKVLF